MHRAVLTKAHNVFNTSMKTGNSRILIHSRDMSQKASFSVTSAMRTCNIKIENCSFLSSLRSFPSARKNSTSVSPSFATMLRDSPFVALGDFTGKRVTGKVVEIVGPNLFIDYGGKFLCVCKMPRGDFSKEQCYGATVHIQLLDWELSARFLGATKDITLLESEGIIVKLFPKQSQARITGVEESNSIDNSSGTSEL